MSELIAVMIQAKTYFDFTEGGIINLKWISQAVRLFIVRRHCIDSKRLSQKVTEGSVCTAQGALVPLIVPLMAVALTFWVTRCPEAVW